MKQTQNKEKMKRITESEYLELLSNEIAIDNLKRDVEQAEYYYEEMKKYIHSDHFKNQQARISEEVYRNQMLNTKIIPIVFHIIHDGHPIGEDENVSVAQIENAVSILNEDYNTLNQDLENVVSEFQSIIGDANIEFRLAKLDPNGNCTNGINRILSNMTNQANDCIKELIAFSCFLKLFTFF